MGIRVVRKDITKVKADVIVNTANPYPLIGAGTDSAIYKAAGEEKLLGYRLEHIGNIERGEARISPGFDSLATYIVHTVGPNYIDGKHNEEALLRNCYRNCLQLVKDNQCKSVVFPLISTGTYGYPKVEAISIAVSEMNHFLISQTTEIDITIAVLSNESYFMLKRIIRDDENDLIDDEEERKIKLQEYGEEYLHRRSRRTVEEEPAKAVDDFLFSFSEDTKTFEDMLKYYMFIRNEKSSTVYNRVKLDRRQFNKYHKGERIPSKKDAIKICIGLRLTLAESIDLLSRADFAFNPSEDADLVIMKGIREGKSYDAIIERLNYYGFRFFDD